VSPDGKDLTELLRITRRLFKNRASDPSNNKRHFEEFYDSVEKAYGEQGAELTALFAAGAIERAQYMNINIANSQIGNFNVGKQIGTVNAAVQVLAATPDAKAQDLATALKTLTEAIHASNELDPAQKKDTFDVLAELATAAQAPAEKRSKGVLKTIITGLGATLSAAGTLSAIWAQWGPAVRSYFGF